VHVDALDGAAALPGVVEGAVRNRGRRRGRIHVVAHVGRVLAAQLELRLHKARRHRGRHLDARRVRPRETDGVDPLLEEHRADIPGAHERLEHVGGDAGFLQQLRDREAGERRELARLVEDRVAGE